MSEKKVFCGGCKYYKHLADPPYCENPVTRELSTDPASGIVYCHEANKDFDCPHWTRIVSKPWVDEPSLWDKIQSCINAVLIPGDDGMNR